MKAFKMIVKNDKVGSFLVVAFISLCIASASSLVNGSAEEFASTFFKYFFIGYLGSTIGEVLNLYYEAKGGSI